MKILTADYILVCDEDFSIIKDGAVCFDEKIIEVGEKDKVIENNPYAVVKHLSKNSVIMPGLINTHVHLEFSANKTDLIYGDFIKWLESVIKNRDILKNKCNEYFYEVAIEQMLQSGVTAFGAISSFGGDLEACVNSPQKVIYFNEILGSNPDFKSDIIKDFDNRVEKSIQCSSDLFTPAISVHSAYSTHPVIAKYAINVSKKNQMLMSTHFMESIAEREWFDNGKGDFYALLKKFNPNPKPMYNSMEYLEMFEEVKTLFVHGVLATKKELEMIGQIGTLAHCFVSNRILNNPLLDLNLVKNKNVIYSIGTDGLSSNNSLNIWDELRAALFAHFERDVVSLAKDLIIAVTRNGAISLGMKNNLGLKKNQSADLVTVLLPDEVSDKEQLALELILHTKKIKSGYINGERYI